MISNAQLDEFSSRLTREMSALSPEERMDLLVRIGRMEQKMRAEGQDRPVWKGPLPENEILGREVSIETDRGTRIGRTICFGIVQSGGEWERSVIVHVPASGTNHEAPGSSARVAGPSELERMAREGEMAERLRVVASRPIGPPKKAIKRGPRISRNLSLLERLRDMAHGHRNVWNVEETPTCWKITGADRSRRLYLYRSQMRCNIAGFSLRHPAVVELTVDQAREMHLGSVRGQIKFEDAMAAEEAFSLALAEMGQAKKG